MKKVICLLIALALCLSLPVAAFAEAVQSPGPVSPTGDTSPVGLWIAVMLVALVALIVTVIAFKKSGK